jgi:hypothetical protein
MHGADKNGVDRGQSTGWVGLTTDQSGVFSKAAVIGTQHNGLRCGLAGLDGEGLAVLACEFGRNQVCISGQEGGGLKVSRAR